MGMGVVRNTFHYPFFITNYIYKGKFPDLPGNFKNPGIFEIWIMEMCLGNISLGEIFPRHISLSGNIIFFINEVITGL